MSTLEYPVTVRTLENTIPHATELFVHGYVEEPVIGPSLPDANSIFVADAAVALIRAGKVSRVRITTKCDTNGQLSVAERMSYYMHAKLSAEYANFPIIFEPIANTTIEEVRALWKVLEGSTTQTYPPEKFMVLALDPHVQRIQKVMKIILGEEMAQEIPIYGAGEILALY